ncbi:MAPEG family protein [Pontibaca methylaminivorans]|uniref:MAPEG family protein n=1 Tax=Pontibaca methylaminivorans TaxID=515897 RepID=A0A1R3WK01_9RHOB|nr:MAPEG family protein [Pontibaca methylaminivorans]SIT78218.1 MAPEG family protein [Pontibaca methylaminivorans]
MTPELAVLALAALLQMLQLALYAPVVTRDLGAGYTMSARDLPPPRPVSPLAGRLKRALDNHFEGLILFTIACLVTVLAGKSTAFTAGCAWTYLGARILYIPAYALALAPARSIIWGIGFLATLLMLLSALV